MSTVPCLVCEQGLPCPDARSCPPDCTCRLREDCPGRSGRTLSTADPYDEDGYCDWCGNGRWKCHAPDCEWADHQDGEPFETAPARVSSSDGGAADA